MLKRLMKSKKGFTLVELMVVVVILGILTAIAVPVYNNISSDAEENACAANVRTIEGAAAMYYAQVGTWPSDLDDLTSTKTVGSETFGPWLQSPAPVCPVDSSKPYTLQKDGTVSHSH